MKINVELIYANNRGAEKSELIFKFRLKRGKKPPKPVVSNCCMKIKRRDKSNIIIIFFFPPKGTPDRRKKVNTTIPANKAGRVKQRD